MEHEDVKVKLRLSALDQNAKDLIINASYKSSLDLTIRGHKSWEDFANYIEEKWSKLPNVRRTFTLHFTGNAIYMLYFNYCMNLKSSCFMFTYLSNSDTVNY